MAPRAGPRSSRPGGRRAQPPRLFRVLLPARDLAASHRFFERLFAAPGREVAPGRVYFDCGAVLLGVLDASGRRGRRVVASEATYFATADLEGLHGRARRLACLAPGWLHGDRASPLGEIVVRPWGERSFYARDPSGNPLCFVDESTVFTGSPRQILALRQGLVPASDRGHGRTARPRKRPLGTTAR